MTLSVENIAATVGIPFFSASEFEVSTMGERKFEQTVNEGLKGSEKKIKRDDIRLAVVDMFIFEEGYNIRDNGHEFGIDMQHATDLADAYDDPLNTIPPVEVIKVVIDGKTFLKCHHGHHRIMGARIKKFRDEQKGDDSEFRIAYRTVTGTEKDLLFSQFSGNSGLALTVLDKASFYFRALKAGASNIEIAKKAKVSEGEVSRYARLYELPEEAKQLIRKGSISATNARTMMDQYPSMEQVLAAMSVMAEEIDSSEPAEGTKDVAAPKKRKPRNVGVKKPSRKLINSLTDSISLFAQAVKESLNIDEKQEITEELFEGATVQLSLPRELAMELLQGGLEIHTIAEHNKEFQSKVNERTQAIKMAKAH